MDITARNIKSKTGPIADWYISYCDRVATISKDLGAILNPSDFDPMDGCRDCGYNNADCTCCRECGAQTSDDYATVANRQMTV